MTKRLNFGYVEKYVKDRNCKLISNEYLNQDIDLEIMFSCGHIEKRKFSKFKYGKNICSRCAGVKTYLYEEVKDFLKLNGYVIVEKEYYNCKKYFNLIDTNGYKYYTNFDKFVTNVVKRGCPLARFGKNNPYTIENINLFFKINNIDLFLEQGQVWFGSLRKMIYLDSNGYKYSLVFSCAMATERFDSNPRRFDISNPYTLFNIINWIKINNKPYCLVDGQEYKSSHSKLKFKCLKCPPEEKEFFGTFSALLSKDGGCPYCNTTYVGNCNNLQYRFPEIASEWDYDKNCPTKPNEIAPGSSEKYYWKCFDCGCSYLSSACKRTGNEPRGCPQCNESNIEKRIRKFLEKFLIKFTPQKRFDDCRDIHPLPFDFYLDDFNILIEGQGLQHFAPVKYFGGKKSFLDRVKKDKIKKDYCIDKNIRLLEIPYWDYKNIESILTKELNLNFSEHEISAEGKEN